MNLNQIHQDFWPHQNRLWIWIWKSILKLPRQWVSPRLVEARNASLVPTTRSPTLSRLVERRKTASRSHQKQMQCLWRRLAVGLQKCQPLVSCHIQCLCWLFDRMLNLRVDNERDMIKLADGTSMSLQALRRGIRNDRGDTAYFLPSFLEDPWEKLVAKKA